MNVILVEDHNMVRQATRLYLEAQGITIVGEATNGVDAIQLTLALKPDVVIMDIHLAGMNGIEATKSILAQSPNTHILVLTAYDDSAYVHALLDAGADGYVLKTAELSELRRALEDVMAGKLAIQADLLQRASEIIADGKLTEREIDVLQRALTGLTNRQIGRALFISDRTVQGHLQNIYRKLGVSNRTEAVTTALSQGLIRMEDNHS